MGGCYVCRPGARAPQDRRHRRRAQGCPRMLRGLKLYTKNLTAIVTVADDGGGSGAPAAGPGHAPARGHPQLSWRPWPTPSRIMAQLMHLPLHRRASLAGQSFGNLFLAALDAAIMPSFDRGGGRV